MTSRLANRWDFIMARVIFGVHPETNALLLGREGKAPLWVAWTDQRLAEHQLPPGYVLRQGSVQEILPLLPSPCAVRVDPGMPQGLTFDVDTVASLVPLCVPFPDGVSVDLGTVESLPDDLRDGLRKAAAGVPPGTTVWFARYRLADGPAVGLVAYDVDVHADADDAVVNALTAVLDATLRDSELGRSLVGVRVMAVGDLPEEVASWVRHIPAVRTE